MLEPALSPINILYVEDNADIRDVVLELIERDDRRIVACADAETAWAHLLRGEIDILVADVNLPGSSGTDLAKRWLDVDASRWVILFTGYEFSSGLASLGNHVRAVRKEDFEQLDSALAEIGERLRQPTGSDV
jgi:two-component system, cell cycle response regulator CpdR